MDNHQVDDSTVVPYYDIHINNVQESKPLPPWIRKIIFKSLGIKTHANDRPWFATILYVLTLASAMGYSITNTWYTFADVKSRNTKFDVLNATVILSLTYAFCGIALYANQLAYKLFTSKVLVDSVRLHSKTMFKINIGILILVCGLVFIGLYDYQMYNNFKPSYCLNVSVPVPICHVMYPSHVMLSAFCLLWNLLVGIVCISVCRTHTHSIRRFLLELDMDVIAYELNQMQKQKSAIDETDQGNFVGTAVDHKLTIQSANYRKRKHRNLTIQSTQDLEFEWDQNETARRRRSVAVLARSFESYGLLHKVGDASHPPYKCLQDLCNAHQVQYPGNKPAQGSDGDGEDEVDMDIAEIHIEMLSNQEILNKYWKLQCRLRTTSIYLQRWLASWIILLITWSVFYLIYWIDHDATISDMVIFFIPLICLPMLCSAPTEVNGEGQRVAKSIVPTEERMQLIGFIMRAPLSITIFGMSLNYATVVGAIVAIALAFATKILVAEV
ncbi:uncharacterized protein LOC117101789 [Anneissia japonica]|uniref:uncharacterized protein LOC117101789 n=1 Tax=Anneissia japonica TaxID=1529436 RepID=UPI00142575EA|nr:uncharacterized protein LOC117101789 [Anneissia japonica]